MTVRFHQFWLLAVLFGLAAVCNGAPGVAQAFPPAPLDWRSTREIDHPLAGRLWDARRGVFLALEMLPREIMHEEFVLLGEVHDNPDHHRLRGWMLASAFGTRNAARAGARPPAVVSEHIRADQQLALDRFNDLVGSGRAPDAGELFRIIDWPASGWPSQTLFEPLYTAVLSGRLRLYAGDPLREEVRQTAKSGLTALTAARRASLLLDLPLGDGLRADLLAELEASHCGLMPRSAFERLAEAQRLRDGHLARRMMDAAAAHGAAVLIAGNGHVRADRGVPWYLARMAPERKAVTVMLIEVEPGKSQAEAYVQRAADGQPVAEFVVFTPRPERPDPCEEMRAMFDKMKRGAPAAAGGAVQSPAGDK